MWLGFQRDLVITYLQSRFNTVQSTSTDQLSAGTSFLLIQSKNTKVLMTLFYSTTCLLHPFCHTHFSAPIQQSAAQVQHPAHRHSGAEGTPNLLISRWAAELHHPAVLYHHYKSGVRSCDRLSELRWFLQVYRPEEPATANQPEPRYLPVGMLSRQRLCCSDLSLIFLKAEGVCF